MVYRSEVALRHVPKQVRGERKVDQILRSAEEVFAEVGYEHATTNEVARHAGVSIGSLYQFFASKDALLETMAQRYLDQTRKALAIVLDPSGSYKLRELLTELLQTLVKLQEQRPYFLQCLGQNRAYAVLQGSVTKLNQEVVGQVARLLLRTSGFRDTAEVNRQSAICVHTVGALLPLALSERGPGRRKMVAEIVTLLERYLSPDLNLKDSR